LNLKINLKSLGDNYNKPLYFQISDSNGNFSNISNEITLSVDSINVEPRRDMRNDLIYGGPYKFYFKNIFIKPFTISNTYLGQNYKFRIVEKSSFTTSNYQKISHLVRSKPDIPIIKSFDGLYINKKDPIPIDTLCYGTSKKYVIDNFTKEDIWERNSSGYENLAGCSKSISTGITICLYKGGNSNSLLVTESGNYRVNRTFNGCTTYSKEFKIETIKSPDSPYGDLNFYGKAILADFSDSVRIVSTKGQNIEYIWKLNESILKISDDAFLTAKKPGFYTSLAKYKNTGTFVCSRNGNIEVKIAIPYDLNYIITQEFFKGKVILKLAPNVSGGVVTNYSIKPDLPNGLTINPTTGIISGTPLVTLPTTTFVVTATNSSGSTSTSFQITIKDAAPASLTYPAIGDIAKGTPINPIAPNVSGGVVTNYSIKPDLPNGLTINPTTGIISGTPLVALPTTTFVVTATTNSGNINYTIKLSVKEIILEVFPNLDFSIYPNPTSKILKISPSSTFKIYDLKIFDLQHNEKLYLKNLKNELFLDIETYKSGIYIIEINSNENQFYLFKILKE
jgi:hypothetical protein